ncbi:MAG TPA: glycosyltransferase family 2 protein [Bryobacteraceae bacterium]|nr:glycosyltransferase family 2 protein [Bryobacteraceae bacterium]
MERVAIVVVTFNSGSEIGACLDALQAAPGDAEIVVVDNASSDNTREEVAGRSIRLIANQTNAGFATAVNQGVRATTAPLILSLNPDARLVRGLEAMADCLRQPGAGAAGGMLIGDDGYPQTGFMARNLPSPAALVLEVMGINRLWPRNPVNWHYRCLGLDRMKMTLVDQPAGAFLMFSRMAWETVGGFDERFWPIWFEDVDFCARLKSAGFRIYYHPGGVAKHSGSHSTGALVLEKRERYWYGSLLEYAAKHYRSAAFRTTCVAVAVSAVLRAVAGFPRYKFKALAVYGGIVSLALSRAFHHRGVQGQVFSG